MPIELPTDYYLTNFCELIKFVSQSYEDLLTEPECQYAERLLALPQPALRLYIRLLCRSKSLFRLDKLKYPEIGCIQSAAAQLESAGFLLTDPELDIETALTVLTKSEVVTALKNFGVTSKPGKGAWSALKRAEIELIASRELPGSAPLLTGMTLLESKDEELFEVYKLCFFGNLYQDMTDFVLRDLGLAQYESYPLDSHTRAFRSREQIQQHLDYYCSAARLALVEPGDTEVLLGLAQSIPDQIAVEQVDVMDAALLRRLDRLRNQIARQLEREEHLQDALALFEKSTRPPARERRVRIMSQLGHHEDALALCHEVCGAPGNEEELHTVAGFAARLAKRHSLDWQGLPVYKPEQLSVQLENTDASVEMLARDYFSEQGQCFYTENVLCNSVFGLVFWDVIFAPVTGAFFNPFQSAPADFHEVEFQHARQQIIAERMQEVAQQKALVARVKHYFDTKYGLQNPMVSWKYLSPELLDIALERIPVQHWIAIFERLLEDLRAHRNGFPDLILFPHAGGYEFLEIKGPGDTLQKNQLRWMSCFSQVGIRHRVCHVTWTEVA